MRADSLRIFITVIVIKDLKYYQVDVNNAFTEIYLKHDIYMSPPSGYDIGSELVLKIERSLYRLRQAAKNWYNNCNRIIVEILKFTRSSADLCIYVYLERGIIVGLYVDNIIIISRLMGEMN